ncbi:MAG: hypothetical protein KF724_04740 [Phycisphaeraceae bacterium]|nr:hypothetical protein [Phycisphaeraceae bacterium]
MTPDSSVTLEQGRTMLAATLLFALVLVIVLTGAAWLFLSMHRRRMRKAPRALIADPVDAWRESGRRLVARGEERGAGPSASDETPGP